jgi:hypothetical protein
MSNETIERKRQDLKELARLAAEMPRTPPPPAASSERLSSPALPAPVSARFSMEPMVMPTPQPFAPVLGVTPPEPKKSRSFAPAMFIGACVVVAGCGIAMTAMLMKRPHAPPAAAAIFVAPPTTATQPLPAEPAAAPLPAPLPVASSTSTSIPTPAAPPPATKVAATTKPLKGKPAAATPASTAPSGQSPSSLDDLMRKAVGK